MASPRSKLKKNVIDQPSISNRIDRKYRKYKEIEVLDRHEHNYNEESTSEDNSDTADDYDELCFDETDRANIYPELQSRSGSSSILSSPRSHISTPDSSSSNRKYLMRKKQDNVPSNLKHKLYPKLPADENSAISFKNICIVIILLFSVSTLLLRLLNNEKEKEVRTLEEIYQVIKPSLMQLKEQYPQTTQLWAQVLWQIQHITSDSPDQPSTLFFIVPEEAEVTANCFIKKLCSAIANGFQDDESIIFDSATHTDLDSDDFKYELDNSLSGLSNVHCAVVHNIQRAVPKAVMLLHGYCDNENAIFKRALIIFTMISSGEYEAKKLPQIFQLIQETLMAAWGEEMRTDDIAALISRIATSPVIFKPERSIC